MIEIMLLKYDTLLLYTIIHFILKCDRNKDVQICMYIVYIGLTFSSGICV